MSATLPEARILDFQTEKQQETDSWTRADAQQAEFVAGDELPEWTVKLPDSEDSHVTWLVEADSQFVGLCTCDGFRFHEKPCAHLCARRKAAVIGTPPIPERDLEELDVATDDVQEDGADRDVDDVQGHLSEEPPERELPDRDAAPSDDSNVVVRDQDVEDLKSHPEEPAVLAPDEFADQLAELPDQYVMQLGGKPYIRREGYAMIAHRAGLRVRAVPEVAAHETGFEHALYRAQVWEPGDDPSEGWEDVGTAHISHENLDGAAANLDELAATRAVTRALSWATGAGMSAAEVQQGGPADA